jgi:TRAP-type C4-dicarboxylate transport system permease small subunit
MSIGKLLNAIEMAINGICIFLLGVIVAVLSYAVVMRYVFHCPPGWSMDLSTYLFIWMVMLGAALVTRERSHIQVTFFANLLPESVRFVWLNVVRLCMLAFCVVMIYQGIVIYPIFSVVSSSSLHISMGWIYLAIPIGGGLMGIYILEAIIQSIYNRFKADRSGEKFVC